jgi:hypothetical protein
MRLDFTAFFGVQLIRVHLERDIKQIRNKPLLLPPRLIANRQHLVVGCQASTVPEEDAAQASREGQGRENAGCGAASGRPLGSGLDAQEPVHSQRGATRRKSDGHRWAPSGGNVSRHPTPHHLPRPGLMIWHSG